MVSFLSSPVQGTFWLKKSEMNDLELIKTLSELYLHYELQNQLKQNEEESKSPRILYSKFVGD